MTTRSVASALGLSASTVNRTELGSRVPDRDEMSALCALYGVTGEAKRELIELVGEVGDASAWVGSGRVADITGSVMALEREAVSITQASVALIPGLTQTAEYTRAVLENSCSPDVVERIVTRRLGRQALLSRPNAPAVTMFIEEGALHRSFGKPGVLREQLEKLLAVQRREHVSVRVTPFDASGSPGIGGPFVIYEFADGSRQVFVESSRLCIFIGEPSEIAPLVKIAEMLDTCALDEQGSSALIRKIAEGLASD
ncbi:helix-turn-helix transcriptional regulator [Saccharopolyspora taberi]|uniref:Helix-turn-helix transcriptional regulator n=2 Tax=Saccharopolyspora taberi TaxID=60895 RepID=A0ABN3VK57_9PSEU